VLLPGRESLISQRPLTDFGVAVDRISSEIQPLTDKPYALFGHSLGAALAFEVGCCLERRGVRGPLCLIVSGRGALHRDDRPDSHDTGAGSGPTSALPDAEFINVLREMGGTPPELLDNSEIMEFLLPVIRADFHLSENYRWDGSRIGSPLLVLGGASDPSAKASELTEWGALTTAGATVRLFDGGHFFLYHSAVEVCQEIAAFIKDHHLGRHTESAKPFVS
jgi:surfactin synthase thioesterase subunit